MGSLPIGISGSRAAAVLGISKYTTQLEVWQQLCESRRPRFNAERGYIFEPFEGNASTRFGHAFEDSVITLTEQKTGLKITDQEGAYSLDGKTPITCHIDGRFDEKHIFEGKTVYIRAFDKSFGEPGTDRIPVEYQCQVQSNMMVTGAEQCTLSALVFPRSPNDWEDEGWEVNGLADNFWLHLGKEQAHPLSWATVLNDMGFFHTYEIKANRDTQKLLRECYDDFWHRYVIPEVAPECADYSDIKRLFTAPKGELILPSHMIDKCTEYGSITKEIGDSGFLAKRKVELKTEIVGYLRDKTTVESDDAQEKVVCLDDCGNKVASFDGKTFRT